MQSPAKCNPQSYPQIPGLDYCGTCRPTREVGGDYYDFIELPNHNLGIAIGDVSGKGVPASLLMASLQASLRAQTIAASNSTDQLMANINRLIYAATPANRYATLFYGQYDPDLRRLTYVNAGHMLLLFCGDGAVLRSVFDFTLGVRLLGCLKRLHTKALILPSNLEIWWFSSPMG